MQDKHNIEELFQEGFRNFEEPVRPELWKNISSQIGTAAPSPSTTNPSPVTEVVTSAGKISGSIATWLTAAAIIVSGVAGYYYFQSSKSNNPKTEVSVNQENSVDLQNNPTENTDQLQTPPQNSSPSVSTDKVSAPFSDNAQGNNLTSDQGHTDAQKTAIYGEDNSSTSEPIVNEPVKTNSNSVSNTHQNEENHTSNSLNTAESSTKPSIVVGKSIGYAPLTVNFTLNGDIQKAEWEMGDGFTEQKTAPFEHTYEKPGVYTVAAKIYDSHGISHSEVVKIEVLADLNIKNIPNVFTPNQDGSNDIFTFKTENITDFEVTIFDKSGKTVYKWTGADQGWNGKYMNGEDAPEGTYFYVIFAAGNDQQKHQQGGTVTLIR